MKCKKCGQEVPLAETRCPHCHRKLYRKRDVLLKHKSSIGWVYMIVYVLFGLLIPQYIAWQGYFQLSLFFVIMLTMLGILIHIILLWFAKKEEKYNQMEIRLLLFMLLVYVVLGLFYYDMMERLIVFIRFSI